VGRLGGRGVNYRKSVALLELLSSYHASMCTKMHYVHCVYCGYSRVHDSMGIRVRTERWNLMSMMFEVLSPLAEAGEARRRQAPLRMVKLSSSGRIDAHNQSTWSGDRVVYSTSQHYRSCEKRCLRYNRRSRSALPAF
jgi:hypothetical protein